MRRRVRCGREAAIRGAFAAELLETVCEHECPHCQRASPHPRSRHLSLWERTRSLLFNSHSCAGSL